MDLMRRKGEMKELTKILEIFNEMSLKKVFLFSGILFMASSFIQYNEKLLFLENFNCIRLFIGAFFIILFIILWIGSGFEQISGLKITNRGRKYNYHKVEILLRIGNIEDRNIYTKNSVVVLPANTRFDDDCITDRRSALGSFFIAHYPDKLSEVKETMITLAHQESKPANKNEFELGSTMLLPAPFNNLTTVAISAVTTRHTGSGISTDLCAVSLTIRNVFEITADKKIDTIILPVLGSGHGGLDVNYSINIMLLNIKYYTQHYHHIKSVKIIIYSENQTPKKIKLINWRYL
jgi:O-acetyl-ADP-ribose deacetylase (regulator of RNase III)